MSGSGGVVYGKSGGRGHSFKDVGCHGDSGGGRGGGGNGKRLGGFITACIQPWLLIFKAEAGFKTYCKNILNMTLTYGYAIRSNIVFISTSPREGIE